MANKYCPNCGKEVSEDANFCMNCGNPIKNAEPMDLTTVSKNEVGNYSVAMVNRSENGHKEKWFSKNWFVIFMLLLCFPIGILLMWKYKKFNKVMRIILSVILGGFLCVFVIALISPCNHEWSDATVVSPKTCWICGVEEGEPKPLEKFTWPTKGVGALIPAPKSNMGQINWNDSNSFNIYVGNMTVDDFNAYIEECSNIGFDVDFQRGEDYYYAENLDSINLDIWYEENDIIQIQIIRNDSEENIVQNDVEEQSECEKNGHNWLDATCLAPKKCLVCGEEEGEPKGHIVEEWTLVTDATCSEEGQQKGICLTCNEEILENVAMLEHTAGEWEIIEKATYSQKGTRVKYCSVCEAECEKEEYELSEEEKEQAFKDECVKYTYDEIARNPSNYFFEKLKFKGEVIQVMEDGDEYILRVNVTKGNYYWDDTILVYYTKKDSSEPRILEDDIIMLYGYGFDTVTYETVMGASVTIPAVMAEYIDIQ